MGNATGGKISADGSPMSMPSNVQQMVSDFDPLQVNGMNGVKTHSATSDQPTIGAPNKYANTIGQWDNIEQQTKLLAQGKGKGA